MTQTKLIHCTECGEDFTHTFSDEEVKLYTHKPFESGLNPVVPCKNCGMLIEIRNFGQSC